MKVTSSGLDEVLRNLKKFGDDASKLSDKALKEVARDVVKPQLEKNTPLDTASKNPSHLKDNIVVRSRKQKFDGYNAAYVTYSGSGQGADNPIDVRWRAGFVEWGTINQRPQGMVTKTSSQTARQVESELEAKLRGLFR